jgi:hypothetical protein
MRYFMRTAFVFLALSLTQLAFSSSDKVWYNQILDNKIETVLLSTSTEVYNPMAIMSLGELRGLHLTFDVLQADNEFYQYNFIHCDANWKPSNLQTTEYVEGNQMEEIMDFEFSTNVFQSYVNYRLSFPKSSMNITKSGNYILRIFKNFNEEEVVMTRRFMVIETKTVVTGSARPATSPSKRFSMQEIDFEVKHEKYVIQNPFQNIKATIIQNNNWETAIYNLPPLFTNNNELSFNYEDKNLMNGTNEFRFFDIRSLRFLSNNAAEKYQDTLINVVLQPDEIRSHKTYYMAVDYNGKRVIQNTDGTNVVQDGDYAQVHFFLESENKLNMGDVFLYGECTDWQIKDKYRMTYLPDKKAYYLRTKLKQSYYNYHYVVANETGPGAEIEYMYTEGNHGATENEYTILIYHYDLFYGYDKLVGMASINSSDQR